MSQAATSFLPGPLGDRLRAAAVHVHDQVIPHPRNNYYPYALRHRALGLLAILAVLVKVALVVLLTYGPTIPASSSAITQDNILSLTNQSRAENQGPALAYNSQLAKAAQNKANDMAAKGYFSHTSPEGKAPWDFIAAAGYNYAAAGENLAVNFTQAEEVATAWMNSPGHRANLLNKDFKEIGIGIASGQFQGRDVMFVVQMFGTSPASRVTAAAPAQPAPAPKAPAPAPTPAPKPAPAPKPPVQPKPPAPKPAPAPAPKAPAPAPPRPIIRFSVRGENTTVVAAAQPAAEGSFGIVQTESAINAGQLEMRVTTTGPVEKVNVVYGEDNYTLQLKDGIWQGSVPISKLAGNKTVTVQAFDAKGNMQHEGVVTFAPSVQKTFDPWGSSQTLVNFFGVLLNPEQVQQTFYSLFISALMVALVLAIAIRNRVQHLSLIANTSVVIILASALWMST